VGSVFSVVAVVERFVCGPLDEETVFEKWGEEADGAVVEVVCSSNPLLEQ